MKILKPNAYVTDFGGHMVIIEFMRFERADEKSRREVERRERRNEKLSRVELPIRGGVDHTLL